MLREVSEELTKLTLGIPHRRGYLLHGRRVPARPRLESASLTPLTVATAIASQLKLDIYVVNPAARR